MSSADLRRLVEKSATGGQTLMAALEEIRGRLVLARYALSQLQQASVSNEEAIRRLDTWLAEVSNSASASNLASRFISPGYRQPASVIPPELVSAVICQPLRDLLAAKITDAYGKTSGVPASERNRRIADAEQELLTLECAEEAIIRRAEDQGIDVLRRSDADPRAVLCDGEFLKWA